MRNILFPILIVALFLGTACDRQVYDDLEHCKPEVKQPAVVNLHIFSQNECSRTAAYPSVEVVNIYAFDAQGKYVSMQSLQAPSLSASFKHSYEMPSPGLYSFVVWANDEAPFQTEKLTAGSSTKESLLHTLKKQGEQAIDLGGLHPVYVGLTDNVLAKEEEKPAEASANIQRISNTVNVRIEGVENPQDFKIELSSANGTYWVNGHIPSEAEVFQYPSTVTYPEDNNTVLANFHTLKLRSGRQSILKVTDKANGKLLFNEDLIASILFSPVAAANINLKCTHEFDVRLKLKKCQCPERPEEDGTYMAAQLYINNWLIHSYDTELGTSR